MLEVLDILVATVEVLEVPELFIDATTWMDDFFFFQQQQGKHLEKPFLKDLKKIIRETLMDNGIMFYVLCFMQENK